MIIVEESGNYCRPHRHQDKGECFHILEGKLGIISFDNEGIVIDNVTLEAGATLMYQIATNMYHSVIPLTPSVIYHESKLGPFRKENDSLFAPWAPDGENLAECETYVSSLLSGLT
tara:strand:- start:91 stop:438 length:348 start_codon:yes stop_codon:yes gene_type:complete